MNLEHLNAIIAHIEADMTQLDQNFFTSQNVRNEALDRRGISHHNSCGTAQCIAGWAVHMACDGNPHKVADIYASEGVNGIITLARDWLDLTELQAKYLFYALRTWDQIKAFQKTRRLS